MLESVENLLKGETLINVTKNNERRIIELSFYDKQHGVDSDYPCINTCVIDDTGEEWFTEAFFTWTEFIKGVKAYISYYQEESQNADSVYIKECEFL